MLSWRKEILDYFTPQVSKLTIVFDPDSILQEEVLVSLIKDRGFEIIEYEDSISFRFAYESSFRSRWDTGMEADLVVVLRTKNDNENDLPYDLLKAGRKIFLRVSDIFPNLSLPQVKALHPSYYNKLFLAHNNYLKTIISENETKDFLLSHVFEIAPHLIKNTTDLLKLLLDYHSLKLQMPTNLRLRLSEILHQNNSFNNWPVEEFLNNKGVFLSFLQDQWKEFIHFYESNDEIHIGDSETDKYNNKMNSAVLPFHHPDIQSRITSLFIEKSLIPIKCNKELYAYDKWMSSGISDDSESNINESFSIQLTTLESELSKKEYSVLNWKQIAQQYSLLSLQLIEQENQINKINTQKFNEIQKKLDNAFEGWLRQKYSSLYNLPSNPPVMLHQIPRYLNDSLEQNQKVALILIDGMGMIQWLAIKEYMQANDNRLYFLDNSCFAWVPSITSISRQSVFSGKLPFYFADSIYYTSKEESAWSNFWVDKGLLKNQIRYFSGFTEDRISELNEFIKANEKQVLGIVIDKIDKILHGIQLGAAGMLNQVNMWIATGFLSNLLSRLLDNNYSIFITSDHGNIESIGIGSPKEGSLIESKGQRMRIYKSNEIRKAASVNLPDAIEWEPTGLPNEMYPLLAGRRTAFTKNSEILMTHGGANIEEVIVPFIEVSRKK